MLTAVSQRGHREARRLSAGARSREWNEAVDGANAQATEGDSCHRDDFAGQDSAEDVALAFGCEVLLVLENVPGKSYASCTSLDIAAEVLKATGGMVAN
mmetsp:Transcript_11646/g.28638  ORF Transcript_11646/g.28638 Transcript_11646/m.28638 type:complete len:99 (+) Transcript_11646:605-901(+)